jgi:hypothetical protein
MDRQGLFPRILTGAAWLLLLAASSDVPAFPVTEARWLVAGSVLRNLTTRPSECLVMPPGEGDRQKILVGRAAFRAPLLLGGQAARAGLSCASCHRNGRTNADFHFPGLSGAPGTADVTSSLMSKHRGDGVFNPKPIPDLAAPPSLQKVARDPKERKLEQFIHGLIVEEFDGPEPPAAVLDGIAAYVRALRAEACGEDEPSGLAEMLAHTRAATTAAAAAFAKGDRETALVMVGAARSMLGRIDERFRLAHLEANRTLLKDADRELQAIRVSRRPGKSIRTWQGRWTERERRLRIHEPRSLFEPAVLRRHFRPHAD